MKRKRLIAGIILCVLCVVFAAACSRGPEELSEETLPGTWSLSAIWADRYYTVEEYNKAFNASLSESLEFREDGTAVYHYQQNGEPVDAGGTWAIGEDTVTLTLQDGTALTYSYVAEEDAEPFLAFEAKDVNGTTKYIVVFER